MPLWWVSVLFAKHLGLGGRGVVSIRTRVLEGVVALLCVLDTLLSHQVVVFRCGFYSHLSDDVGWVCIVIKWNSCLRAGHSFV